MAFVILTAHLLSVMILLGGGVMLGLVLPAALGRTLEPAARLPVWAAIIEHFRPPALGAVGLLFVTGVLNLSFMSTRPGGLLLIKILLALAVVGHVMAQVRGVGQRLIDAASTAAPDLDVLERAERSLRRLALSQVGLVAVIVFLSLNL